MRVWTVIAVALIALLAAGCGGGEKKKEKPAIPAETPVNDPPVHPKKSGAPAELLGQYAVTLPKNDLPGDAPEELTEGSETWTVTLAETGGPGDGPALTIENDQLGPLESSHFEVKGKTLTIHEEECAQTGKPVDPEYSYELKGDELTLSSPKGTCPDKVAETILTSGPLKKKESN